MSGGTCLKCLSPLGKSSASLGMSVGDLWRGMTSRKSHVTELKNWMPMHWVGAKSQITLRWAGLKVQNGSKNLAIVHGRVRDDDKRWVA